MHLGGQNMSAKRWVKVNAEAGQLSARDFFSHLAGANAVRACDATCPCLRYHLPCTDCRRAENACPFGHHRA